MGDKISENEAGSIILALQHVTGWSDETINSLAYDHLMLGHTDDKSRTDFIEDLRRRAREEIDSPAEYLNAETEAAISIAGGDPHDDATWDRTLVQKAVELGESINLLLTYECDTSGAPADGPFLSTYGGVEVDLEAQDGKQVKVLGDTGEVSPGDSEPLWRVQATDGTIFPAWKTELGL